MKTVQLQIEGMHCGHCVHAVRDALAALPGVAVEEVHIGGAVVQMDDSQTRVGALVDAIYDAGYEASEATP